MNRETKLSKGERVEFFLFKVKNSFRWKLLWVETDHTDTRAQLFNCTLQNCPQGEKPYKTTCGRLVSGKEGESYGEWKIFARCTVHTRGVGCRGEPGVLPHLHCRSVWSVARGTFRMRDRTLPARIRWGRMTRSLQHTLKNAWHNSIGHF